MFRNLDQPNLVKKSSMKSYDSIIIELFYPNQERNKFKEEEEEEEFISPDNKVITACPVARTGERIYYTVEIKEK